MNDMEIYEEQTRLHPRIQSYVADKYFVSTVWRESSAPEGGWYYETIVWEWLKNIKKIGDMLAMASGLHSHYKICQKLIDGKPLKEEEE